MPRNYPGRKKIEAALSPVIEPAAREWAGHKIQRMLGFWYVWHYYGGLDAMIESGHWSKGSVYRQRNEFRQTFGLEVQDAYPGMVAAMIAEVPNAKGGQEWKPQRPGEVLREQG